MEEPSGPGAGYTESVDQGVAAVTPQRKVRTPESTRPANGWAGRPDGKCSREQTADGSSDHRQG